MENLLIGSTYLEHILGLGGICVVVIAVYYAIYYVYRWWL